MPGVRRPALILGAFAAAVALAGCGGSSQENTRTARPAGSASPSPAAGVTLGPAVVTTNNRAAAPKNGSLERLAEGLPAPGAQGRAPGPQSLLAGPPDTSVLRRLPQPAGLGARRRVCGGSRALPASRNVGTLIRATLCLLNAERTARGLRPLRLNGHLTRAAFGHSRNMVSGHYFAHAGADGNPVSRIRRAGYIPRVGIWSIGENLAWGTGSASSPAQIMAAWMNSPEHKANILTPGFKEIGIGIVPRAPTGGGTGATFTTCFGTVRLH